MGYGYVDKIAKLIPFELGITLDRCARERAELKRLYKEDEEIQEPHGPARARWKADAQRRACMPAAGDRAEQADRIRPLYADEEGGSVVRSSTRTTSRPRAWSSSTSSACVRSRSSTGRSS